MRWALWAVMLVVVATLLAGDAARGDLPSFLYTAAPQYKADAWNTGEERFPAGARLVLVTPQGRRDFAPKFFASADAFVSADARRVLFAGRPTKQDRWQIWQAELAGGAPRLIVANADSCIRPLALPDGKVVYTRVKADGSAIEVVPAEGGPANVLTHAPGWFLTDDVLHDDRILFEWGGELYTVYPDGTGVETVRCDHGPRRSGARQVASGDVIFSVDGGLARYTSALAAQEKLGPAEMEIAGPVAEGKSNRWLVAARPRTGGLFAIRDAHTLEVVEAPKGANAVEPAAVMARIPARDFPSALVPARTTGNLLCLNASESKDPIMGKIHSVRLFTRDATGASQTLGQTAIASDGSFYVEVPADQPIRMEVLDAAGKMLRAEERWFWMRPSEQRVCVGCHAGPERAPENRVPEILNQILIPVKMLGDHGKTQ